MRFCGVDLYKHFNKINRVKLGICNICFFFGHCRIEHEDYINISYDGMIQDWRDDHKGESGLKISGEWPIFYSKEMFEYMCPISDEIYDRDRDRFLIWQSILNQIRNYEL